MRSSRGCVIKGVRDIKGNERKWNDEQPFVTGEEIGYRRASDARRLYAAAGGVAEAEADLLVGPLV